MVAGRLPQPDGGHKSFGIYLTTEFLTEQTTPDMGR